MGIDGDSIDIVIVVVILYFILLPEYFGMRRITPKPVKRKCSLNSHPLIYTKDALFF